MFGEGQLRATEKSRPRERKGKKEGEREEGLGGIVKEWKKESEREREGEKGTES